MENKNAVKTVGFIFITIALARILGQAREMIIAYKYGTGDLATAYFTASNIPINFFDMILGSAISSAFIPVYNSYMEKDGTERANTFACSFLKLIILATLFLSIIGILFSGGIIKLIAGDLHPEVIKISSELLKIMFPMIIFIGTAFTFVGILQSKGEFKIPSVMSMISSALCIVYLFTFNKTFGIYGLAVTLVLGWAMQFIVVALPLKKNGFSFSLSAPLFDESIKKALLLALPVLIATWVQPINNLINTRIASGLNDGQAVAAVNYANRLYMMAALSFSVAVTNYIFPALSRHLANGENEKWAKTIEGALKLVMLFVLPLAVLFITLNREIISVIYQRGEFTEISLNLTSGALLFYAIGMPGFGFMEILNKGFYSRHDSVTPMVVSALAIIMNIGLSFILSAKMGASGLALAASISITVSALIALIIIAKKEKGILGGMPVFILKLIPANAVLFFSVFFTKKYFYIQGEKTEVLKLINLCLPVFAGVMAYFVFGYIIKLIRLASIKNMLSAE